MATAKRFEDLEIWQIARELVKDVYLLTDKNAFAKDYGLKDQIRRSSVSVMNNISEGFESRTVKRFIDYLGRSKGSLWGNKINPLLALDCNYISKKSLKTL